MGNMKNGKPFSGLSNEELNAFEDEIDISSVVSYEYPDVVSQLKSAKNTENVMPNIPKDSDIKKVPGIMYDASRIPLAGFTAASSLFLPSEGDRLERANEIIQNPDYNMATSMATSPLNYTLAAPVGIVSQLGAKSLPILGSVAAKLSPKVLGAAKFVEPILENVGYSTIDAAFDPNRDISLNETLGTAGATGILGLAGKMLPKTNVVKFVKKYVEDITEPMKLQGAITDAMQSGNNPLKKPEELITTISENLDKKIENMDVSVPLGLIGAAIGSKVEGLGPILGGMAGYLGSGIGKSVIGAGLKTTSAKKAIPPTYRALNELLPKASNVTSKNIPNILSSYFKEPKDDLKNTVEDLKKKAKMPSDNAR